MEVVISAKKITTVPTSAAGISHVVADVKALGDEKLERLKSGGKAMASYP